MIAPVPVHCFSVTFTICGPGGHLGHGTSIMSSDFHFLVPEAFIKKLVRWVRSPWQPYIFYSLFIIILMFFRYNVMFADLRILSFNGFLKLIPIITFFTSITK